MKINQVAIAEQMLKTDCDCSTGVFASCTECPFDGSECILVYKSKHDQFTIVEKWLKDNKEKIMKENQIVDPPLKCWVRECDDCGWVDRWLVGIVNGRYYCINNKEHSYDCSMLDAVVDGTDDWAQCSFTDPSVSPPRPKIKKWLNCDDVPNELWCNVLFRPRDEVTWAGRVLQPHNLMNYKFEDLLYLPQGQPLTGEWLPFESEVTDGK